MSIAYRIKKGMFKPSPGGQGRYRFRTDHGSFKIDREEKCLGLSSGQVVEKIPFDEISHIEYQYGKASSLLAELYFDAPDPLMQVDKIGWYVVVVVTTGGRKIPLFSAGQLERREFLWNRINEIEKAILESVGLVKNLDLYSGGVLEQIEMALKRAGATISLGPSSAA